MTLSLRKNQAHKWGMIYGYARVSTDGQSVAAQVAALKADGCDKIITEVMSGAADRPKLKATVAGMVGGDTLKVTRLDRLARSTRDLLNTLATITGKGAAFKSLADAWADTTTAHGRLMVTMLAGLAEFERELIHARTSEGRKRAQADGVKMGRPPKLDAFQRREALKRIKAGESPAAIGRTYGVHRSTIERLAT